MTSILLFDPSIPYKSGKHLCWIENSKGVFRFAALLLLQNYWYLLSRSAALGSPTSNLIEHEVIQFITSSQSKIQFYVYRFSVLWKNNLGSFEMSQMNGNVYSVIFYILLQQNFMNGTYIIFSNNFYKLQVSLEFVIVKLIIIPSGNSSFDSTNRIL